MSVYNFSAGNWTPTATGDGTTLANGTYMAIQNGASGSTNRTNINEVLITGEATSSAPTFMVLARDSTIGTSLTSLAAPNSNGPQDPSSPALATGYVALAYVAQSGTAPQRSNSASLSRLRFSFNAYGGIVKWNPWSANMTFAILGASASNGEASLSAFTGGTVGQISSHILYETAVWACFGITGVLSAFHAVSSMLA